MANRTVNYATSIHGTNPQYLIEKIVRSRIYDSKYWKEYCTLLNSALVLERAVDDLRFVGGVYGGNIKPTPFMCLVLKLLQIQPKKEIIYLYIEQNDFKYLRALGAFYLRLVGSPMEIYTKLEPLFQDYRKLRQIDRSHKFSILYMDVLIDNLLREDRVFDVILPRLTKRHVLEDNGDLAPYKSILEEFNLIPIEAIEEDTVKCIEEERHKRNDRLDVEDKYRSTKPSHSRSSGRSDAYSKDRTTSKADGLFSQEEIDNENAIRAMVGLKPLR